MRVVPFDAVKAERIPWRAAERVMRRVPHGVVAMASLNSLGPLRSWFCPTCAEVGIDYVVFSAGSGTPTCEGSGGV